jgi:hypothetical protein
MCPFNLDLIVYKRVLKKDVYGHKYIAFIFKVEDEAKRENYIKQTENRSIFYIFLRNVGWFQPIRWHYILQDKTLHSSFSEDLKYSNIQDVYNQNYWFEIQMTFAILSLSAPLFAVLFQCLALHRYPNMSHSNNHACVVRSTPSLPWLTLSFWPHNVVSCCYSIVLSVYSLCFPFYSFWINVSNVWTKWHWICIFSEFLLFCSR